MSTAQVSANELLGDLHGLCREATRLEERHQENVKLETAARIAWNIARESEHAEELARRAKVLPTLASKKRGAS